MSCRKTVFNEQWLDTTMNPNFTGWLKKASDVNSAYCSICKKTFGLSNMGRQAVASHANGKVHKNLAALNSSHPKLTTFFDKNQSTEPSTSSSASGVPLPTQSCSSSEVVRHETSEKSLLPDSSISSFVIKNDVTEAEVIWAMRVVERKMSLSSCSDVGETFRLMFKDSVIASKFSLGETKCSYMINHGLAPYFREQLNDRLLNVNDYVICFDESLNKVIQKGQMDVFIKYFDINTSRICTQYYNSAFIGRATAEHLLTGFQTAVEPLPLKNLLQVSMDGPNVNLSFLKKLEDVLAENCNAKQLVNIGVCGLHVVDGAVKTGMQATNWSLDMFLRDLYYILNDAPARRAEYTNLTGSRSFPLKYCCTRWLENVACIDRALAILDDLSHFLMKGKDVNSKPYKSVQDHCADKLLKCKLSFFRIISVECEPFLRRFQSSSPLSPYLHTAILDLMKSLMARCVKPDVLKSAKYGRQLMSIDMDDNENLLDPKKVDIGFHTTKHLKNVKQVSELDLATFKHQCRVFLVRTIKKLQERSPLKYKAVAGLSSLNPEVIISQPDLGRTKMNNLLEVLYEKNRISGDVAEKTKSQYDTFCNEAKVVLKKDFDNFLDALYDKEKEEIRLDDFYASLLMKNNKYLQLWEVVKLALIFSHGNASVESGFSVNKYLLTENQKEQSIVNQRIVYEALKYHGGSKKILINQKMMNAVKGARKKYDLYLEKEKGKKKTEDVDVLNKSKLRIELKKLQEERKVCRIKQQIEEEAINLKIQKLEGALK